MLQADVFFVTSLLNKGQERNSADVKIKDEFYSYIKYLIFKLSVVYVYVDIHIFDSKYGISTVLWEDILYKFWKCSITVIIITVLGK